MTLDQLCDIVGLFLREYRPEIDWHVNICATHSAAVVAHGAGLGEGLVFYKRDVLMLPASVLCDMVLREADRLMARTRLGQTARLKQAVRRWDEVKDGEVVQVSEDEHQHVMRVEQDRLNARAVDPERQKAAMRKFFERHRRPRRKGLWRRLLDWYAAWRTKGSVMP